MMIMTHVCFRMSAVPRLRGPALDPFPSSSAKLPSSQLSHFNSRPTLCFHSKPWRDKPSSICSFVIVRCDGSYDLKEQNFIIHCLPTHLTDSLKDNNIRARKYKLFTAGRVTREFPHVDNIGMSSSKSLHTAFFMGVVTREV